MQRLEVIGAVRPIYGSLGVKRITYVRMHVTILRMCGESEVIAAHTHTHTHTHTHILTQYVFLKSLWLSDPFWLRQITTDPNILALVNTECPDN
jgi:hypothetical protein